MIKRKHYTLAALSILAASVAFANGDELTTPELWNLHCKKCHGSDGKGKTKVGKKLQVRDYTDPEVQKSFTDEEAVKVTLEGVTDEDTGKELMKPYAEKLKPEQVDALVQYIREFAPKEEGAAAH